jgi:hypothetical protein
MSHEATTRSSIRNIRERLHHLIEEKYVLEDRLSEVRVTSPVGSSHSGRSPRSTPFDLDSLDINGLSVAETLLDDQVALLKDNLLAEVRILVVSLLLYLFVSW